MRIAIAAFQHESNTFATTVTDRAKFVDDCFCFDSDLVKRWGDAHHEVGGFLEAARTLGFDPVPLVMAKATPGGPVDHAVVEEVVGTIVDRWNSAPAEGLLLALHGAMVTTRDASGDTVVLRSLRAALGPDTPIVLTLDFHGNLTEEMVRLADAIFFYQTNPHTDMRDTGIRAGGVIHRMVRDRLRPTMALRKPPMILPINHQSTARDPLRRLLDQARRLEERPTILRANLAAGFPYADVPEMGPAIVVVSEADPGEAERAADELADALWNARSEFTINLPDAAAAVTEALSDPSPPVVLVDFGDNVGGGSSADGTFVLAELIRRGAARSVVVLADPEAVEQCVAAGVGQSVSIDVGGKTDNLHGEPVRLSGTVRSLHDGKWIEPEARHGGVRFNDQGTTAVVRWGDDNLACLTSRRYPPFSLGQLTSLGIDPSGQQVLVVKAAIAYRAAYVPIAGRIIEIDTPGLTAVNPAHFRYQRIRRPMWPLDSNEPS